MTTEHKPHELRFIGISGINYPTKHRPYLLKLVREVAIKHEAAFVLVAGNTVDGRALEKEYKGHMKYELKGLKRRTRELTQKAKALEQLIKKMAKKKDKARKSKEKDDKKSANEVRVEIKRLQREAKTFSDEAAKFQEESFREDFESEFVERHAQELNSLIPVISGVNYHIAIAEKIYDRPLGTEILERLRELREDVRLIGALEDGSYDPEPKVPHQLKGFGEIRVILPSVAPWFYRILSAFMQRLINGFIPRTHSPKPDLILTGCTGTSVFLPSYDGVASASIPTLHKLNELRSTENMVGASVFKLIAEKGRKRIVWGTYDFRPAIFNERNFSISQNPETLEYAVLKALIASPASSKTVVFRIAEQEDKKFDGDATLERVKQTLGLLVHKKLIVYNRQSNQYAISEKQIQQAETSLESLFKNSTSLRETVTSCFHCGCLKTLYHTCFHYLPQNAIDSDILVENGDEIQGNAHAYDYNGELLPTMMAYDKQERTLAAIRSRNIMDIFKLRFEKLFEEFKAQKATPEEIATRCLIKYIFQTGNHPAWKYFQKHSLILGEFEELLKASLTEKILDFCSEKQLTLTYQQVKKLIGQKIVRVGESFMVHTNGFAIGIKHPYKARTESKSHRIQDVVNFIWREFLGFTRKTLQDKNTRGFVLVNVANFHEAGAVHVAKFGRTAVGVMTGAQVKDTRFESHMDKVVDHGTANVLVVKDPEDRLLYSEIEYDDRIHPDDEKMCFADQIMTSDVLELCQYIDKEAKIPWRYY